MKTNLTQAARACQRRLAPQHIGMGNATDGCLRKIINVACLMLLKTRWRSANRRWFPARGCGRRALANMYRALRHTTLATSMFCAVVSRICGQAVVVVYGEIVSSPAAHPSARAGTSPGYRGPKMVVVHMANPSARNKATVDPSHGRPVEILPKSLHPHPATARARNGRPTASTTKKSPGFADGGTSSHMALGSPPTLYETTKHAWPPHWHITAMSDGLR